MIFKAIEIVSTIMLLIATGILISHLGWYKVEHKSFLSNLIINVSVPAVIIKTFFHTFPRELLLNSGRLLFISFLGIMSVYIVSIIFSRVLKLEDERKASFESLSTLSNVMFIGLAVSINVYGEESTAYVMIFYMVANIMLWAVFAPKFKKVDNKNGDLSFKDKVIQMVKNLISIPLVTLFVSIFLAALGLKLPNIIINTADYLGSMSTPLSLIFIGGVIYEVGIKNIGIERDSIFIILIRFIIGPILMFIIGKAFKMEDLPLQVFTLISGMPPMTQLGVIASSAESEDSKFVMASISLMTILSLVFIPIYIVLMPKFL